MSATAGNFLFVRMKKTRLRGSNLLYCIEEEQVTG